MLVFCEFQRSFTTLKTQCKNQNESILESGIPLQKAFEAD